MTEDDTYEALRRIPRRELENGKADAVCHTIAGNVRVRRADEKINEKERKVWKIWNKFSFLGINYPMMLINCSLPDGILEPTAKMAFDGTGWTYESYVHEINKDIDEENKRNEQIKKKRFYFMAVSIVLLFPFIWYMIALVPWPILKPLVGLGLGLLIGQGLAFFADVFIS